MLTANKIYIFTYNFLKLTNLYALKLGLTQKQIDNSFKRLIKAETKIISLIHQSFLSKEYQALYIQLI